MSVIQSCQNVTSQPASSQRRPRQAVSLTGSCQSMTSPQPVPSARSPCRHTRSPQAAHDPVPQHGAPGLSFRVPPAGRVARGDSDLRQWLGGRCASVRLTRPERLRRLPLRLRRPRLATDEASRATGLDRGGAQGEAGGPAPAPGGPRPRGPRGPPAPGAPRCLPGRLAPHSRWEATQEGPVSLRPRRMSMARPVS